MWLICLCLCSCGAMVPVSKTTDAQRSVTDSTTTRVVERRVMVAVPMDKAQIKLPVEALRSDIVFQSKGAAQASVRVERTGDTIVVNAVCDSLVAQVRVQDSIITRLRKEVATVDTVERLMEKRSFLQRLWDGYATACGIISLVVIAWRVARRIIKNKL